MGQQDGILPIRGTIDNINFYKSGDGYLVRKKGGVSAQRIASDPAFLRTRENGVEFGRAAKAGKLLRNAFKALLIHASDSKTVSRLTKEMIRVLKADTLNARGKRSIIDGEVELLKDFEFNINGKLGTTLYEPFTTSINRVTGQLEISIPSFIPANMLNAPSGTTHFRINSAGAEIDFEEKNYVVDSNSTAQLPWNNVATAAITLTNAVTAASTHPLFLVLGVEFYQEVNGTMYPLMTGQFNPLALVNVSGI